MSTSPKSPSTLKRPAPPTRDSSSSIQVISPQKTKPTPAPKSEDTEPPAKKAKIALVNGGAGSGGQTKLAFGKAGGQTRLNFGKTGSSVSSTGGENKTSVGVTGGSSSTGNASASGGEFNEV